MLFLVIVIALVVVGAEHVEHALAGEGGGRPSARHCRWAAGWLKREEEWMAKEKVASFWKGKETPGTETTRRHTACVIPSNAPKYGINRVSRKSDPLVAILIISASIVPKVIVIVMVTATVSIVS